MASVVTFEERVEIPMNIGSLADFRRWVASDSFPQRGRIDYIASRIEVDMSPEDFFCHGTLKGKIYATLLTIVERGELGHLVTDSTRVSCPHAELSTEPDIVFISHVSLDKGSVRLVPKATGEPGRYVEVEGAPDLVVEIVSDTSVKKDTEHLLKAYYRAGVREYWLVDARGEDLLFQIHAPGESGYERVELDPDDFQSSAVLRRRFRLIRDRDKRANWKYDLVEK